MKIQSKFEKVLNICSEGDNGVWIKSTRTLRQLIGILGVSLPLLLIIFSPDCTNRPLESISHYFYVRSGTFFIVILSLIGIFLIIYTKNFILSSIAGICALLVVFFPTTPLMESCSIVDIPKDAFREGFHYISAAIFLIILAFMSIFRFTRPDIEELYMHKTSISFKWLYISCGIIMLLAISIIGIRALGNIIPEQLKRFIEIYDACNLTFWMETLALEAFGIAWLVRGRKSVKTSEFISYRNENSRTTN